VINQTIIKYVIIIFFNKTNDKKPIALTIKIMMEYFLSGLIFFLVSNSCRDISGANMNVGLNMVDQITRSNQINEPFN
jgi:hypothetical protein